MVGTFTGHKHASLTCLATCPAGDAPGEQLLGADAAGLLYRWEPSSPPPPGSRPGETGHVQPLAAAPIHDKEARAARVAAN